MCGIKGAIEYLRRVTGCTGANWTTVLVVLMIGGVLLANFRQDYYLSKWYALVVLATALLAWTIYKKMSIHFAQFYGYLMLSAASIALFKFGPYMAAKKSILFEPLTTWVYLASVMIVVLLVNPRQIYLGIKILVPIHLIYCLYCLWLHNGIGYPMGFDYNRSVNGTLLSMMLPFCMNIWTVVGTLFVIAYCKVSIGMAATLVGVTVFYFMKTRYKMSFALLALIFAGMSLAFLYYHYGAQLADYSSREVTWKTIPYLVAREGREMFGYGTGTFSHLMPSAKFLFPKMVTDPYIMFWAHNDLLQFYFENGWYGYLLVLPVVFEILRKSMKSPFFMAFFAAYFVNCLGNFPSHLASTGLLLITVISLVYREDSNEIT